MIALVIIFGHNFQSHSLQNKHSCTSILIRASNSEKLTSHPLATWSVYSSLKTYAQISAWPLILIYIEVAPVTVARNLGKSFHSNLNLQEQIHKTCKSGFFHLYNIRRIGKYLSQESARTLVHAFIITARAFYLIYPLFIYLNCNACRMQLLGLYLMSLATVT